MLRHPTSTPLELIMALHYCTVARPYSVDEPGHRYSQCVREIQRDWLARGYLELADPAPVEPTDPDFRATEALRVWVHALCCVPKPVQEWIVPDA